MEKICIYCKQPYTPGEPVDFWGDGRLSCPTDDGICEVCEALDNEALKAFEKSHPELNP